MRMGPGMAGREAVWGKMEQRGGKCRFVNDVLHIRKGRKDL